MVSGANIIMNNLLLCIPILVVCVSATGFSSSKETLAAHGLDDIPPQSTLQKEGSPQTIQQLLMVNKPSENQVNKPSPQMSIPLSTLTYPKHTKLNLIESSLNKSLPIVQSQRSTADYWGERLQKLFKNKKFRYAILSNFINGTSKKWLSTGNELWDGVIQDCMTKPTFSCLQKNVYNYLDRTLLLDDVNVTNSFFFIRNQVNYTDQLIKSSTPVVQHADDVDNEIDDPEIKRSFNDDTAEDDLPATPIEEVTNALYGKGVKFAMTHDVQLKMPKMFFDGSILRISPRSFEGNGALVKIELEPDTSIQNHGTGRLLFKKIKKIFKNKLLLSFLAIVLILKMIKIKVLWLLPLIVGVSTAKKMILKFLLFMFPALSHIFKLCSWYHHNYHHTKFHHHQHHINHLHTVVPPWYEQSHTGHESPTLIYTKPPTGHPAEYIHSAPSVHQHSQPEWEFSGPGLGSEYIGDIHRNAQVGFEPKVEDLKEMKMWGLFPTNTPPTTSHSINSNPLTQPSKHIPNSLAIKSPQAQRIVAQYTPAMNQVDPRQNQVNIASVDPFYGPILAKIDSIFAQLGVHDEPCKERLLCSMYKNPNRYSPHSNFISAELSRDANELKKPSNTNIAVMRFYRYIQAARDGQEQKDCLAFYPQCAINTENKR